MFALNFPAPLEKINGIKDVSARRHIHVRMKWKRYFCFRFSRLVEQNYNAGEQYNASEQTRHFERYHLSGSSIRGCLQLSEHVCPARKDRIGLWQAAQGGSKPGTTWMACVHFEFRLLFCLCQWHVMTIVCFSHMYKHSSLAPNFCPNVWVPCNVTY